MSGRIIAPVVASYSTPYEGASKGSRRAIFWLPSLFTVLRRKTHKNTG